MTLPSRKEVAEVRDILEDQTDGPVTEFVLIARAVDLAAFRAGHTLDAVANALYESLDAHKVSGDLPSLERR